REAVRCGGEGVAVNNWGCDQDDTKENRGKMKTNDAPYVLGRLLVVGNVVSGHPIFVAPDVTQQDEHEACQIEDEFLNGNCSAYRRNVASECGCFVWKDEESAAEEEIQSGA